MMRVLQRFQGDLEFHHENGEISTVTVEIAGVGIRWVRVSTLPPEVTEVQITNAPSTYREVKKIHDKVWSDAYRFNVKTDDRLVDVSRRKHILSHMKIYGHRALISYEGQPMTCYRCSEQGHQINDCPRRKLQGSQQTSRDANSWAKMVKRGTEKAPSVINSDTNNVSLSSNGEASHVIKLHSWLPDEEAHKQDPMTMEHHLCPPADKAVSLSDDINMTDIVRMDGELNLAPPNTHATCPNATKWSDLIITESDAESDREKQGKKREK